MKKKLLTLLTIVLLVISYYIEIKSESEQEKAILEIEKSLDAIPYRGSFILIELQHTLNDLSLKDKDSLENAFLALPEKERTQQLKSKLHFYNDKSHRIYFIKRDRNYLLYTFGDNQMDEEGLGDDESYDLE